MFLQDQLEYTQLSLQQFQQQIMKEIDENCLNTNKLAPEKLANANKQINITKNDNILAKKDKKQNKPKQTQPNNKIRQFLEQIDEEHNSQDQGIQDYNIGGYHPVHIGQVLLKRYVVIQKLGWGHFSTVWLCKDFKHKTYVAIKIQKSSPHYMQAALDQVQILQKVQMHYDNQNWQGKTRDDTHIVGLLNAFIHKTYYGNHFCMVFEILRCNLLDLLKRYDYQGVPLDICQEISKQVLKGLDYLHRICGIIHTDLKPENVMLCLNDQEIREIVQNGQLRSNELFAERTKIIQQYMGISCESQGIQQQEQNGEARQDKNVKEEENSQVNTKVQNLEKRLKNENLNKNQKKKLRKKIKQLKQKENVENQFDISERQEENLPTQNKKESLSKNNKKVPSQKRLEQLFDLKKGKIQLNRGGKISLPLRVKIADLGNACWKHHSFSTQIQTRQYRSPEVILGQTYNETADIWSYGCMMYQMLTGDLLFQPRKTDDWGKNDDHLAQMQELLGNFHPHFIARSPKMKKYFDKKGRMKKFPKLNHYSLDTVLQLKNKIKPQIAKQFAEFLIPTLIAQPQKRVSAKQALLHPWLSENLDVQSKMSNQQHRKLHEQFNKNQQKFRNQKMKQDCFSNIQVCQASCQDNDQQQFSQSYEKKKYKICDIRLVDRSFTDLGYIGYCQGIDLQKLDSYKNWQFS